MTVADVAYRHLTPSTKNRVMQLLALNPYFPAWKKEIGNAKSKDEFDAKIFMLAATWPDAIKGDPAYHSDGGANGNRPPENGGKENIGYADKNMHKYWHFCDLPYSVDGTNLPAIPEPNARTQIHEFRKVLASDAPDELKSYDLTWLLHIVGDVHQPLHCVTRVSSSTPDGDNGGNNVQLEPVDSVTNLHAYWDNSVGTADLNRVDHFASRLKSSDRALAENLDENEWIDESYQLAKDDVYMTPIGYGTGPFRLNRKYSYQTRKLALKRAELAGERLAAVLNNELK